MILPTLALALTVVLDPGHGGSNLGAATRQAGLSEKQVTLQVARRVARRLSQAGVEVLLTRDRDDYLPLGERVRRSNGASPVCFVSIHTNSSVEHARRGVETFVLSRTAAELTAERQKLESPEPRGTSGLLAELESLETHRASVRLARAVQRRLGAERGQQGPLADRGVRQASYDVLIGQRAPSILVEIGFIDHPIEGRELLETAVQERIAGALADGILTFVRGPELAASGGSAPAVSDAPPTQVARR